MSKTVGRTHGRGDTAHHVVCRQCTFEALAKTEARADAAQQVHERAFGHEVATLEVQR